MSDSVEGQGSATSGGADYNALSFIAQQILSLISTSKVVQVIACTNNGGVSPVGFVDVQPLVNQLDGAANAVPHAPIYQLPYSRLQGGGNAIIIDPKPGDIGVAVFADRDISSVKANKAQANPGSFRKYDIADGIYLGMILNGQPNQYVRFYDEGIDITDINENTIEMNATGVIVNGVIFYRDHSVWSDNEITAKTTHTVSQHTHSQGLDGHGDSEVPTDKPTG